MNELIKTLQIISGPTTPYEKGEGKPKINPFQYYATAGNTGLPGFESPGSGSGRYNRGLDQTLVYNDEGFPYWVTWRVLDEVLDTKHKKAKAADKKFLKLMEKNMGIFEATREVLDIFGAKDVDVRLEYYTYNYSNLSITQDVQIFGIEIGKDEWLVAAIFHTGVDARCGFSGPVFGIYNSTFRGSPESIFYLIDTDEIEWQVSFKTLENLPKCAGCENLFGLWDAKELDDTWRCFISDKGLSFGVLEYEYGAHYKLPGHFPEWWEIVGKDKVGNFFRRAELVFNLDTYLDEKGKDDEYIVTLKQVFNGKQLNLDGKPPKSFVDFVKEVVIEQNKENR